jgi:hypothetical protein
VRLGSVLLREPCRASKQAPHAFVFFKHILRHLAEVLKQPAPLSPGLQLGGSSLEKYVSERGLPVRPRAETSLSATRTRELGAGRWSINGPGV